MRVLILLVGLIEITQAINVDDLMEICIKDNKCDYFIESFPKNIDKEYINNDILNFIISSTNNNTLNKIYYKCYNGYNVKACEYFGHLLYFGLDKNIENRYSLSSRFIINFYKISKKNIFKNNTDNIQVWYNDIL